jgi:tectonic-1/3
MSMGMSTEIVYANTGALANPQPKIIGVNFKYEAQQDITYTVCHNANVSKDPHIF